MFETRADEKEYLDSPEFDLETAEESFRLMQRVNRYLAGTSEVCRFLEKYNQKQSPLKTEVIKVLDIGSGACDIPLAVTTKLNNEFRKFEFTCIDVSPAASAIARKNIQKANSSYVRFIEEDIFDYQPGAEFDFATGSMFFHHLSNEQILQLIGRLRVFVKKGIFINDLCRSPVSYSVCKLLVLKADPVIKHDALLSICRGFTEEDLRSLLLGVRPAKLIIERRWFYRITASILF